MPHAEITGLGLPFPLPLGLKAVAAALVSQGVQMNPLTWKKKNAYI